MDTTKRTATVSVRNNTSKTLLGVSVVHKYSDVYKHQKQWGQITAGELASEHLAVEYNTGLFTTGRDWWAITWFAPDMKTLYYSNPNNFRNVFDNIEQGTSREAILYAASLVGTVGVFVGGPVSMPAALAAASAAVKTTDTLYNSATTTGFKQHILREEDEDKLTEIIINEDLTITFKSESGISETVSASRPSFL